MEVLTSVNRMSATTFLSLYFFSSKYGTGLHFNVTGPADNTFHRLFITNFIFIAFLTLCIVLLCVQLVTACDKLCKLYFSKYFNIIFKKIYRVLQTVIRLYQVARQCHQFYAPEHRSRRNMQGLSQ